MALPPSLSERERQARLRSLLVGYEWDDAKRARNRLETQRERERQMRRARTSA